MFLPNRPRRDRLITSDPASASVLTDALSEDDKQVWYYPPKLPKSETEQKRYYEMVEHHIFKRYLEELKHASLNDELTAGAFYESKVASEKRLWNFRATNEFGEKTPRPFTEVDERRKELLDLLLDGWGYVEPGSRSEKGG